MSKFWILPLLLASASALADGLSVELNVRKSIATGMTIADVMLVNSGTDTITVLSKGLGQGMGSTHRTGEKWELALSIHKVTWNGHEVINSASDYSPVTLKPGECAQYQFFAHPFENPFKRIPDTATSLIVTYRISPEQGKRYGVWSGSVSSKVYIVKDGQIQE